MVLLELVIASKTINILYYLMKYKIGFSNKQKKNTRSYKRRMLTVGLCVSDYEKSVSFMMTPFITVVAWWQLW